MRLFIAINFDTNTRLKLISLSDELRTRSVRGNFVTSENFHLTLAFLDDCNPEQVLAAKKAMAKISFKPFDLRIDSLGRFKRAGSDLWWAGVRESKELMKLQRSLFNNLTQAGFSLEKEKFRPHITLGRKVITRLPPRKLEPFGQLVSSIDLMKSESFNDVLFYTSIYQVP